MSNPNRSPKPDDVLRPVRADDSGPPLVHLPVRFQVPGLIDHSAHGLLRFAWYATTVFGTDGEGPVRGGAISVPVGRGRDARSGRGIDARTSRCCPPSPDGLLGPSSRDAIRGSRYKGQELRGRRSRQSNSFQTRPMRVYSSILFRESIAAGFGGWSMQTPPGHAAGSVRPGPHALWRREAHPSRVLAFDSIGHGRDPVVLLIHGWPLNRSIWSGVAARIAAAGSRVLAPDLPGFGDSPSIGLGRATVEAYADEVAKFIGPFKARRVAVAGHSFGGYVALALAEKRPDAVAALGLIASRTAADSETARRGRHDMIEKVRAAGTKALLPGLAEKLVGARAAVERRPQATLMIERARPGGMARPATTTAIRTSAKRLNPRRIPPSEDAGRDPRRGGTRSDARLRAPRGFSGDFPPARRPVRGAGAGAHGDPGTRRDRGEAAECREPDCPDEGDRGRGPRHQRDAPEIQSRDHASRPRGASELPRSIRGRPSGTRRAGRDLRTARDGRGVQGRRAHRPRLDGPGPRPVERHGPERGRTARHDRCDPHPVRRHRGLARLQLLPTLLPRGLPLGCPLTPDRVARRGPPGSRAAQRAGRVWIPASGRIAADLPDLP